MNSVSYCVIRVIEKACTLFHMVWFYENTTGLKNINLRSIANIGTPTVCEYKTIDGQQLYLGADFLKDDVTLLDTPLCRSPHYDMMQRLLRGEDIAACEYILRTIRGTLDSRKGIRKPKNTKFWETRFAAASKSVEEDSYAPAKVYSVDGRYYLYDGKHRAALCAAMEKPVRCEVISADCVFAHYGKYMFEIIEKKQAYYKHRCFYEKRRNA